MKSRATWTVVVGALISCAWPALGATKGPLDSAIRLEEVRTDQKGKTVPLDFDTIPQDVDINSIIRVRVGSDLLDALPADLILAADVDALVRASKSLREAVPVLVEGIGAAYRGALLVSTKKDAADKESRRANEKYSAATHVLNAYADALDHAASPLLRERRRIFTASWDVVITKAPKEAIGGGAAFTNLLVREADWVNEQLKRFAANAADRPAFALVMHAYASDKNGVAPVHLEHYDDLPPGAVRRYEKIRMIASPEEEATLRARYEETKAWTDLANQVRQGKSDLKELLNQTLKANLIDVEPLQAALKKLRVSVETLAKDDPVKVLEATLEAAQSALLDPGLSEADRASLQSLLETLQSAREKVKAVSADVSRVQTEFQGLLSTEFLTTAGNAADPVEAMFALMKALDARRAALADVKSRLGDLDVRAATLKDNLGKAATNLEKVADRLKHLSDAIRDRLRVAMPEGVATHVKGVHDAMEETSKTARDLLVNLHKLGPSDELALESFLKLATPMPEETFPVAARLAKDTYIDLRTIDARREGDYVHLEAKLYRVSSSAPNAADAARLDPNVLGDTVDEASQTFHVMRFWFYSSFSVVPTYTFATFKPEGSARKTQQFAPAVTWSVAYRGWPNRQPQLSSDEFPFRLGLHTIALDLNQDGQQEIGFGGTVTLWKDVLQIGGGGDANLDWKGYWFIGLGLLTFGKSSGVATSPGVP